MAQTQQARKSNELIEKMNALLTNRINNKKDKSLEFQLAGIKNQAKALTNKIDGHIILGMIASFEGKGDQTRKNFSLALSYSPNDPSILKNYAVSLDHLGYYNDASKIAKQCYLVSQGDTGALSILISANVLAGNFFEAFKLLEEWNKISPEHGYENSHQIIGLVNFIENNDITQSEIQESIALAISLVNDAKYIMKGSVVNIIKDDASEWINYDIEVDRPVTDTNNLNMVLIDKLIEKDTGINLKAVNLTYLSRA